MKNKNLNIYCLITICFVLNSCIEPFDFQTISFEDALVVEATITDELKHQEINLTRTFQFEEDAPVGESQAVVTIIDSSQRTYNFEEISSGKYLSVIEFRAEPDEAYELAITTRDGRTYTSSPNKLPQSAQIEDLSIVKETNSDGISGLGIYASSFDPTGNARYYRYEYEATYKIRSILWSPFDAVVVSDTPPFQVAIVPREQQERICFSTSTNTEIMQTETIGLQEDRVSQFPIIQFIASTDPIIRERYSIIVRQYVQSAEAFNYYRVLSELSGNESLLSQNQPGFVNGNISSMDDPNEKVLGFFEIASVSSKRMFFNFRDIFTEENFPFFFVDCEFVAPRLVDPDTPNFSPLINLIKTDQYRYFENNLPSEGLPGPYLMIQRPCGDCTTLGTNVRPDFWID